MTRRAIIAAHLIVLDIMATPILLPVLHTEARDLTASTQALSQTWATVGREVAIIASHPDKIARVHWRRRVV